MAEWSDYAEVTRPFEWKWYYAFQQVGDQKAETLAQAYREGRARRDRLAGALTWLAPPALLDRSLQSLAGVELQERGRKAGTEIERHLKNFIIRNLKILFGRNWDIEIGAIRRKCEDRAKEQMEKYYKEGLGRKEIPWTDQFTISDYKTIIEKYWTRRPAEDAEEFETFEDHFSIDIGYGFNGKSERLKWLSMFGTYRNTWAHEGTKESGLNLHEVENIEKIYKHFGLS